MSARRRKPPVRLIFVLATGFLVSSGLFFTSAQKVSALNIGSGLILWPNSSESKLVKPISKILNNVYCGAFWRKDPACVQVVTQQVNNGKDLYPVAQTDESGNVYVTLEDGSNPEVKGVTAIAGTPGAKGDKGDQGEPGPAGADGARGPIGLTGPVGPKGDTGPAGEKGDAGEKGATGDVGPAGADGVEGPQGPQGIQGIQGIQGEQGIQGPAGADGADGSDATVTAGNGLEFLASVLYVKLDGTSLSLSADGIKINDTYDDNFLTTSTNFGGDVSGAYSAIVVADDSHAHTSTTLPGTTSFLGSSIETGEITNLTILDDDISASAAIGWSKISKVGSNLTDLATKNHNDLDTLQGGTTSEYYHLTSAQNTFIGAINSSAAELNYLAGSAVGSGGVVFGNGTNFTQDTSNLFWDNSSKYLGLGTNEPASPLHLSYSTDVAGLLIAASGVVNQSAMELQGPLSTSVNSGKAFQVKAIGEGYGRAMFYTDGAFGIGGGSSTRDVFLSRYAANQFRIDSNKAGGGADLLVTRNFSVGTVATSSRLRVYDSNAKTADYSTVKIDAINTSSTDSVTKTGLEVQSTGTWNGASAVNRGLLVNVDGGTTNYAAIFTGGNVGIETDTPSEKLHIQSGNAIIKGIPNFGTAGDAAFLFLGDTNNSIKSVNGTGIQLSVFGAANAVTIQNVSGRVGIGTTDPSAPLTVLTSNGTDDTDARVAVFGLSNTNMGRLEIRSGRDDGSLNGRYTSLQAWSNELAAARNLVLNPEGSNVGIGNAIPFSQLANTASNITNYTSVGVSTANSLAWNVPAGVQGYAAAFQNQSTNTNANGLLVKITGTTSSYEALTVDVGGTNAMRILGTGLVHFPVVYNDTVGATNHVLYIDNTGLIGKVPSSLRYKENVANMEDISWIYNLRPVNYTLKSDPESSKQYGMIAEEVAAIDPYFVLYDDQGRPDSINYDRFITPIIKAIQGQKITLSELEDRVDSLESIYSSINETLQFNQAPTFKKGIEIVDQATGEVYCSYISNGENKQQKGKCSDLDMLTTPQPSPTPTPTITPTPTPSPTVEPTPTPQPSPSPEPSIEPSPEPTPTTSPQP